MATLRRVRAWLEKMHASRHSLPVHVVALGCSATARGCFTLKSGSGIAQMITEPTVAPRNRRKSSSMFATKMINNIMHQHGIIPVRGPALYMYTLDLHFMSIFS
jgi:hypothetical protein